HISIRRNTPSSLFFPLPAHLVLMVYAPVTYGPELQYLRMATFRSRVSPLFMKLRNGVISGLYLSKVLKMASPVEMRLNQRKISTAGSTIGSLHNGSRMYIRSHRVVLSSSRKTSVKL